MKKQENLIGGLMLLSGAIIGAAAAFFINENKEIPAGKVLQEVRHTFPEKGKIIGSWIDYDAIEYHGFDSKPLVYIGGLSLESDKGVENYQFAADVYSGSLINYFQI